MITRWGVKNFKSILEADLDLAPLTIFTGVNSSGKSSFLQSIVMLAQSARSNDSGTIVLGGNLINLDNFDLIYNNKASEYKNDLLNNIGINFTIPAEEYDVHFKIMVSEKGINELSIAGLFLECKKFTEDKGVSIKCIKYKDQPDNADDVNTARSASDFYDELWRKARSNGNIIVPENDSIELDIDNVSFKSFIPERICYKLFKYIYSDHSFDEPSYWKERMPSLTGLLADIPSEEVTIKEHAENYAKEKIDEHFHFPYFSLSDYNFVKQLFYICANNLFWRDFSNVKSDRNIVMFHKIPYFKELFDNFKKQHKPNNKGGEFYDIKLSDWYQVLSKQDKHIQEIIKKKLIKKGGFEKTLYNYISDFKKNDDYLSLPKQLDSAYKHLYEYFRLKIEYLGPLREEPKRYYEEDDYKVYPNKKDGETDAEYDQRMRDVGVKGEKTPLVLYYFKHERKIKNYFSPDFFETPDYKPQAELLFDVAFQEWLKYIGICEEFTSEENDITYLLINPETSPKLERNLEIMNRGEKRVQTKDGQIRKRFEFYIVSNGQKYALPQLGTGVSQVLPILVMCLAAPVGSTLIIQEPEKNLHPKWQSRLADFFIAMSLSGRQCLIETHSEYIIEQLRYRILMLSDHKYIIPPDHKPKHLHESTKLYFVTRNDGISHFQNIKINEYAALDEWPEYFFDESHKKASEIMDETIKKMGLNE